VATGLIRGWAERLDGWVGERSLDASLAAYAPDGRFLHQDRITVLLGVDLDASKRGIDFVVAKAQVRLDRLERRTGPFPSRGCPETRPACESAATQK
jgi:hypothetical protein